uniref:Interleukin 20 receptor subunit beta n=1 Tax=Bos taurus TaxID=9913 RepID=F6RIS1_BOVIN
MVLEEIKTSLIMWFSYALIPCLFVDGVAVLPAPQNLSVQSTNMKHVLTWSPVTVPEEIVHYSVEYQGEYESLYTSHIWIPSIWCSPTQRPECDITEDITATVSYSLRVRATLGSLTSTWSTLKHRFNQNSTILTPPGMEITMDGFHLLIKLEDLGPHFEFFVSYWRREPGAKEHIKVVRPGVLPVYLETVEPGAAYCVKARTFREGHRAAQCLQPDRMCQGARRGPASGAGPVCLRGLHADPGGGAALRLEDGPAAPALLLPRGDAPRHLENNKFTPEVNQLQKRRGRSLCDLRALF